MIKIFLANALYVLHILMSIPIILPFFYKSGDWLKYNCLLIIFIFLDWNDHTGQCSLTSLEAKLRGKWKPGAAEENPDAPAFCQPTLNKLLKPFNMTVSRQSAGKINTIFFLIALLVSFVRLLKFHKISLLPTDKIGKLLFRLITILAIFYIINFVY